MSLTGTLNQRCSLVAVGPIERQRTVCITGTTGNFQVARPGDLADRGEVMRIQIEHGSRARRAQGEGALGGEICAQL